MGCHDLQEDPKILGFQNKVLLMGSPNVGKSVFFSALTGIHVVSSNYAGTTVSYMEGKMELGGRSYSLIDVPGTYTMSANSEAEAIAVRFAQSGPEAVLFVLDATNLEGGLRLALELKEYNLPTVYALNMTDVAERKGIHINVSLLSQKLGGPVIPTVAVKKDGFDELKTVLEETLQKGSSSQESSCGCNCDCSGSSASSFPDSSSPSSSGSSSSDSSSSDSSSSASSSNSCGASCSDEEKSERYVQYWEQAKTLAKEVTETKEVKPGFLDRLGDKMVKPWPGIPIAIFVIVLSLGIVVGAGKALRAALILPLINNIIVPFFQNLFTSFIPEGILLNVLVGEYGIFVISFEWILGLVIPYVIIFQFVFTFLEDCGYLPRISVLFDNIMRKLGVQGGSLINIMLAFGCAVPAIIGTRSATTKKERLMVTTMICFSVPCISQMSVLIAMTSDYSMSLFAAVLISAFIIFISVALLANKVFKGKVDPLVIEVPNLLMPNRKAYFKKLWIRIKQFIWEAEGPMLLAVFIAAIFKETGMLDLLAVWLEPFMVGWLGLPGEAVMALILGIVRREMSVAPLLMLHLSGFQMYIGAIISLLYLPCLSVFGILAKEFNAKTAVGIVLLTTVSALFVGGVINHVGSFIFALI
ncbi:GTPase Era [Methanimicrococcus sp. At1]|uniref:Ferrous iron transport protein B n=1 Tax=Methanimicrococcus hacksteinii TaxID=3028293 RepID=A0ABU3VMP9_9EURY|nr:ferrous iron transport protein B [Methanimicrococcus sp. At1]MDV0444679.1 GTPase Era [Methanimicrococcus sp. At1]